MIAENPTDLKIISGKIERSMKFQQNQYFLWEGEHFFSFCFGLSILECSFYYPT